MKRFLIVFVSVVMAMGLMADYKFPGYDCKDAAKYTAAAEAAANAKNLYSKCNCLILAKMLQNPVSSFSAFCTLVDSVIDAERDIPETQKPLLKVSIKKNICYFKKLWPAQLWEFCQANPSSIDVHFVVHRSTDLGIKDAQLYTIIISRLLHNNIPANYVAEALDKIAEVAPNLTGVDVKADLQKLNRKYSVYLYKDKAKWEPVIAKLRTMIETY